ncbi:hypothetical protein [uncultured Aquimarina sp.]|uniref:hypothetical protein n=1 Tax=uncultured Aquimarina sp. TaxID=575652 RepID=UPI00263838EA|nr:hypothetical protein [uncultured Aquimarina sp.]
MKKLSIWCVMIFTLLLGFTSCEENEEFETCPDITINIDNVPGSAVYRFVAQLDGIEDVRFTWSIDGEEVDTGNLNDIAGQIFDYQFEEGTHTICVKVASDTCPLEVCKEIEVERDETDPCPDLFFEARQYERPNKYKFIADFPGIEETPYEWFINGELVENDNQNDDNYLFWEFNEPGRYEVCIKSETPDCPNGASYCKVIEVEEIEERCPEVSFVKEMEPGTTGTYVFEAQIEEIDAATEIQWYINGDLIENPTDQQGGARVLTYQFEPGVYEVCLKVFTEDCPDGVIYCKEIRVGEDACPDLFFIAEQDGDNPAYYFQVEFEGADQFEWLGWFINGEFVEDSNNGDNNRFYYQFEPGRYEVCLKTETPECPEGTSYCKVIEIPGTTACPELFFEAEQDGDNPAYYFYPSAFDGIDNVTLEWSVNGDYVGTSSGHNDPFYFQFNPGRYEVCLSVETPDCPEGVTFCKVIEVEETTSDCPNLNFQIEQEGDTPGYNFWAEFEGMSDVSYEWTINGEVVNSEIIGSNDRDDYLYYQFGSGTYEICIIAETPNCPNGTTFCKTLVIE